MPDFPLFPVRASTMAGEVDRLCLFLIGVSGLIAAGVFLTVLVFAVRYRRRPGPAGTPPPPSRPGAEVVWIGGLFVVAMAMFLWGAEVYDRQLRIPEDALEVRVLGKQWMWKVHQPTGQREINELHVPVGRPIKLVLSSQDVIHSFFVPAFRMKQDAVPGRTTTAWFTATRPGTYRLLCAEYCGTGHSAMIGRVVVLEPRDYERWLGGFTDEAPTLAAAGRRLFERLGCASCHHERSGARGPDLAGLFGSAVKLAGGETVTADEDYVREAILRPAIRVVAGYEAIMPAYEGQIGEEGVLQLVEYLRSAGQERPR